MLSLYIHSFMQLQPSKKYLIFLTSLKNLSMEQFKLLFLISSWSKLVATFITKLDNYKA